MRLLILLIAVISAAWAQTKNVERPVRAPQGQIKHENADGSKINWHFALQNQWRSQLANAQRHQRAEGGSPQRPRQTQQASPQHRAPAPQAQPQQLQPIQSQQFYRPYAALPGHIRQLIESTYQPQAPYVDPSSFLYGASFVAPQQYEPQPSAAASDLQPSLRYQSISPQRAQPRLEYDRRLERQDRVVYKNYEQPQEQQQQQQQEAPQVLPIAVIPELPIPPLYLDKNMPSEIKQLLKYQAQIPYDVTANRIQYKPKSIFIPKPLSDDVKGPYYYRSKIYYTDDENVDAEYPQDKPVDEGQRH
ncbi:nuclear transcription factor Y subunit beta-like [Linepithema humile]|uniref:nuclear transcription factor Y subunit beta-like n=1 Tax=Linepithema humile TaxID=83485 RepID=UPI0006239476|nr:PREDICTED: putative uncharacterized protein DDB_G0294196 [Linepithema humile]